MPDRYNAAMSSILVSFSPYGAWSCESMPATGAVLMCERATLRDPEMRELGAIIVAGQRAGIADRSDA
jgi:hypothetical protein